MLSLQARYTINDSRNEGIVARLLELHRYECAVMREHGNDHGIETESGINHKASALFLVALLDSASQQAEERSSQTAEKRSNCNIFQLQPEKEYLTSCLKLRQAVQPFLWLSC